MGGNANANEEARAACVDTAQLHALLDGQLAGDDLARVEKHLHRCSLCSAMVADAAHGSDSRERLSAGAEGDSDVQRSDALSGIGLVPGTQIDGKYEIEGFLKQGGMGAVFSARHMMLGHPVAIKVLHTDGMSAATRFLREAKTCARFVGDHIVRVSDYGRLPSGAPYLVMEYLTGRDLAQVIAQGPVPPAEAVRYVREACAGLREAHAAGVIHRDLKPSNLFLVTRPLQRSSIKVLDFGISKIVREESRDTTLTSTGVIIGSPLYMSPEQIRSDQAIDVRTDVWSLGVILHELLTGKPPFRAPTLSALAVAIVTQPSPHPCSENPALDEALGEVVLRCLQKEPARRFGSVEELAQALDELGQRTDRGAPRSPRAVQTLEARPSGFVVESPATGGGSQPSRGRRMHAFIAALAGSCTLVAALWLGGRAVDAVGAVGGVRAVRAVDASAIVAPVLTPPRPAATITPPEPQSTFAPAPTAFPTDANARVPPAFRKPPANPGRSKRPSRRLPTPGQLPKVAPPQPRYGPLDTPD